MSSFRMPEPSDFDHEAVRREQRLLCAASQLDVGELLARALDAVKGEWRETPLSFQAERLRLEAPDPGYGVLFTPLDCEAVGRYVLGVLVEAYTTLLDRALAHLGED
jgi:hypothetical protein